jgi:hypothetical protein
MARNSRSLPVLRLQIEARRRNSTVTVHIRLSEALLKGPPPAGNLAVPLFTHGSLEVELYTPKTHDAQKPHARDEVYVVARGAGASLDTHLTLTQREAVECAPCNHDVPIK